MTETQHTNHDDLPEVPEAAGGGTNPAAREGQAHEVLGDTRRERRSNCGGGRPPGVGP